MPAALIKLQQTDGVARLTLARPEKRNALTRQLLAEMRDALETWRRAGDVRLLILAAEGSVFCAGMDLAEMQAAAQQPDAAEVWSGDAELFREVVTALFEFPAPVLAVVQGPVVAGGVGLVGACDLVLAAEEASFALPEPRRGIIAAIVTPLLACRIGGGRAGWLLYSGRTVRSQEAERFGLIHELGRREELSAREQALIRSILTGSPAALAATKRQLHASIAPEMRNLLAAASVASGTARETADAREGLAAFLEKRPPRWQPPEV